MEHVQITGKSCAEMKVCNSRFLAELEVLSHPSQVKPLILKKREEHPHARHVVYAFCTGTPQKLYTGFSDDKEPHGSAGKPLLTILQGRKIINGLITVVRYWGGTKLGIARLSRTYKTVAKLCMQNALLAPFIEEVHMQLCIPHEKSATAYHIIKSSHGHVEKQELSENCLFLSVRVPKDKSHLLLAYVRV